MPLPAGITGVPRLRRWDATTVVEVPELAGETVAEVELVVRADGSIDADARVAPEALARLAGALDAKLRRPYLALAVRKGQRDWAVAGRQLRSEVIALPAGIDAETLELVIAPGGSRSALVDGELVHEPGPELEEAFGELESRARERFESFAARADRVRDGRWDLTVDPL